MKKMVLSLLAASVMSLGASSVSAQEIASPALAKIVESQMGVKPQRIIKTPYLGGLYEIYAGGQLFYSDEKGSVFVFGSLIDGKTHRNITAEQQLALLPLQDAIKRVNAMRGIANQRHTRRHHLRHTHQLERKPRRRCHQR